MGDMTDTLPPYTANRPRCSKCGHNIASTKYSPEQSLCVRRTPTGVSERLCRVCDRCGHHWDEALATNDQAAPFRDPVPLGQQFTTDLVYTHDGRTDLLLTHSPSGLKWSMAYPKPALAEAAQEPLRMFQALLDEVDAWQREPIGTPRQYTEAAS